MQTCSVRGNSYRLNTKHFEDDYICLDSEGWDKHKMNLENEHALYNRDCIQPGQRRLDFPSWYAPYSPALDFPSRHALCNRDLIKAGQRGYNGSDEQEHICSECHGCRHVGGQHMRPPQFAHEHRRTPGAHDLDESAVCPVMTSVAVGLIAQGAMPQITKHYDEYIKPTMDSALQNAKGHIEQISKNTLPPSWTPELPQRTPGTNTKTPRANRDCSVM